MTVRIDISSQIKMIFRLMKNIQIIANECKNTERTEINDTFSLQNKYASKQVAFAQITIYALFVCI